MGHKIEIAFTYKEVLLQEMQKDSLYFCTT